MIRHLVLASALKDIDSHFASLGVDYMPVKGTQFVAEECWQRLKTRTVSDIDILVNREDFNTVCGHFHNCENVAILHDRGFFSKSFKMGLGDSSVKLDISYQLNRPERFSLPTRDLFDRGIQVGGCRVLPTREDAALLAICDGKNALAQTFHKNQLLADIHVFMLSEAYDWDRFLRTARSTGIYPWICSVLSMYEKWSGVSLEKYSPPLRALVISRLLEIRKDWWPKWVKLLIFEVPFAAHPLRLLLAVPIDSIFRA